MLLNALVLLAAVVSSADGVLIHYSDQGKGDPALVFIHSWSSDRHLWDNQVPVFAKSHRVITIDLAGHGESGRGRNADPQYVPARRATSVDPMVALRG